VTPEALIHEVVVVPRSAFAPLADIQVIRRPGWMQIITPTFKGGGLNEVCCAVLDAADADAIIDRTIAEYRALGLVFRWTIGPDSRPHDLGARLEARGLVRHEVLGMCRETRGAALTGEVEVERVTMDRVDEFTAVMTTGWGMDPAPFHAYHRAALGDPERRHRLFLARDDSGRAVGAAGTVLFEKSAYLIGAVVLPEHRKRGVYRALTDARLADAAALGRALATTHARAATSAPLLERRGFQRVCRFASYGSG